MRGALATMGFYTLYFPHRRKLDVNSSYFCEDASRFKSKLHILEQTKEYDSAIQHWRVCAQKLAKTLQEYRSIQDEVATESLKTLRHAKSELKRCKDAHAITAVESDEELSRLEKDLNRAQRKMEETAALYGEDDVRYDQAAINFHAVKKVLTAKRRSYFGRLERLSARIVRCSEVISREEATKRKLLSKQEMAIKKARSCVLDARSRIEHVMQKVVGDEVFVPGKILFLLEEDPNVTEETAAKILELTPNYKKSEWHFTSDPGEGTSPLITECIHDDVHQSMADLIVRVCYSHNCQFTDAMVVLLHLRATHNLYRVKHYHDGSSEYVNWSPMIKKAAVEEQPGAIDEESSTLHTCVCSSVG